MSNGPIVGGFCGITCGNCDRLPTCGKKQATDHRGGKEVRDKFWYGLGKEHPISKGCIT